MGECSEAVEGGGGMQLASSEEQSRVKITIEDRKRSNMVVEFYWEKIVSERRTDDMKSLRLHSVQESCVRGAPPTHVMRTPYEGGQGPCIWTSTVRGRETGGDDTERPTSRKLI